MPEYRKSVELLKPYYKAPLQNNPARLDQNTNLFGANPVLASASFDGLDLSLYPTRDSDALLAALGEWYGISPDQILVGNGSDEVLDLIVKCCVPEGGSVVFPWPSYALYPYYCNLLGIKFDTIPLRSDLSLDPELVIRSNANLLLLATPNNPTGRAIPEADILQILTRFSGWVVLDEAYIEYHGLSKSFVSKLSAYPNLIIMRTFSKAYGLAGLRVGVAIANYPVMQKLRMCKPPFNLNQLSERIAIAALDEQEWVDWVVAETKESRAILSKGLQKLGCRVVPSDANFVLAKLPSGVSASAAAAALLEKRMLIRTFPAISEIADCLRITLGPVEQMDELLKILGEYLGSQ